MLVTVRVRERRSRVGARVSTQHYGRRRTEGSATHAPRKNSLEPLDGCCVRIAKDIARGHARSAPGPTPSREAEPDQARAKRERVALVKWITFAVAATLIV